MARPTKKEIKQIEKRNEDIFGMIKKGYPRSYICLYFGISKGRLSLIIKENKNKNETPKN